MAQYIVSARKYRPDSFESLIGQDNIARTLKNSILRGQLAHAYLFCGPRGVGKTSAARIFAKTINCASPGPDMEPCGECESCVSFREGRSYCIHELDAASNNGVEDIKALMEQVQIPPQVGRYSVYIIDEVHMLSQAAFNSFLKTLEEPPAHAIFILCTTEKHKIIPTILSRCQTYDFNRISIPDIVRNLRDIAGKEGVNVDEESLHVIAGKADGAMRDALTIFDQTVAFCGKDIHYEDVIRNLNVLDYEYSFRLVDAFLARDYGTALLIFDEILSKGFNAIHFVSALGSHLRDLLVSRTGGLEALLDLPDSLRERYSAQASRCSVRFLYDALGIVSQCEAGYRASTNQRLHIEYALMKIAFLGGVPESATDVAVCSLTPAAVAAAPRGTGDVSPETADAVRSLTPAAVAAAPRGTGDVSPETADAVRSSTPAAVAAAPRGTGDVSPETPSGPAGLSRVSSNESAENASSFPAPTGNPPAKAAPSPATKASEALAPTEGERSDVGGSFPRPLGVQGDNSGSLMRKQQVPGSALPSRKRAAGLSLSSLLSGEEITVELAAEDAAAQTPESLPDVETVKAKWAELAASYSGQPRLANALATTKPEVETEDGRLKVVFPLINEAQRDWIEKHKLRELEDRLSALLSCKALRLQTSVVPPEKQEDRKYMPAEKAQDLMSRNPEVASLVTDLGLDVK